MTARILPEKYKGVHIRFMDADGYVRVVSKYARCGWEYEHRLVVEEAIGRRLRSDEAVHHKNADKADNRRENLSHGAVGAHVAHHNRVQPKRRRTIDSAIETLLDKAGDT